MENSETPTDGSTLEIRRKSDDKRGRIQPFLMGAFTLPFGVALAGCLVLRHPIGILISTLCTCTGLLGLFYSIRALANPFEHVCVFTSTEVRWSASNGSYATGKLEVKDIKEAHIDFDDQRFWFSTGSMLAKGIGADIDFTTDVLKGIRDYVSAEWPAVRLYTVQGGVRQCVSRESNQDQSNPVKSLNR